MKELWLTKCVGLVSYFINSYICVFIISCAPVIQTQASELNIGSAPGYKISMELISSSYRSNYYFVSDTIGQSLLTEPPIPDPVEPNSMATGNPLTYFLYGMYMSFIIRHYNC